MQLLYIVIKWDDVSHGACIIMAFLICQRVYIAKVHANLLYLVYLYRAFHIFVDHSNWVALGLKDCSQLLHESCLVFLDAVKLTRWRAYDSECFDSNPLRELYQKRIFSLNSSCKFLNWCFSHTVSCDSSDSISFNKSMLLCLFVATVNNI